MRPVAIPGALARLLRRQELYLLVAVSVYAIYWTATGAPPRVATTLIYTLFLGNFTMLALESLTFSIAAVSRSNHGQRSCRC